MTPIDRLHPDLAAMVGAFAVPVLDDDTLELLRSFNFPVEQSDLVERTEHLVPGDPAVPLRSHRTKGSEGLRPCLYSMHGGGFVMGSYASEDGTFGRLCPLLDIVGVAVEYRWAPETRYPGPLEDCYRGLKWTHDNAEQLGIDRNQIGIAGLSSGGGLAASLALLARDRGEIPVAFQLLETPALDDRQVTASSQVDGLPVWSREANTFGWRSYLGELYGTENVPYTAAPARAEDLSGLPPAFVAVGSIDGFLDESVAYAMRLNHAGVPAELHVYPGACHGYQMAADCEITVQSRRDIAEWLARQIR